MGQWCNHVLHRLKKTRMSVEDYLSIESIDANFYKIVVTKRESIYQCRFYQQSRAYISSALSTSL